MTAAGTEPEGAVDDSVRCAVASLARQDSMVGTALPAVRFLLVEDPGPWGPGAHPTGSLPHGAAQHVEGLARALVARLLLIRRPGRAASIGERHYALADLGEGTIAWGRTRSAAGLEDIDPVRDAVVDGSDAYLVCTHGRHDRCCALEGRPVARELAAREPDATWECSHIGGDRFAGNVLVLPSGLVYGRVTPDAVGELLDAQRHELLVPRLLRGRCGVAPAGQVAESHVRLAWDEQRIGAVLVETVEHGGHETWTVTGRHAYDARTFVVELHESHDPVESGLTCASDGPSRVRTWTVVGIDA